MLLGWITAAQGAECGFAATETELVATLERAEEGWAALDPAGFRTASDELRLSLPCVQAPLSPATVARIDRVRALALFAGGHVDDAHASLRAAREIAPDYVFPDALLPPGDALRVVYESASGATGATRRLPPPKGVTVWLDGEPGDELPLERPVLFQVEAAGHVTDTRLLGPGEPPPAYPVVPVVRNRLLASSLGLAAGSAASWGGALASKATLDRAVGVDALRGVQQRTNLLGGLSVALLVGAASTATAAALVEP